MNNELDFSFAPQKLLISSLRDSGYKTTAHALAELIDNSIQAESTLVEVFCEEEENTSTQRRSCQLKEIAVLDNGHGMDSDTLRIALQLGNGTRLNDRSGIGRFGMGLPNASISQTRRVEIWTWQNGQDNALYSYLDVDEIESGELAEIPAPEHKPLPDKWRELSSNIGVRGTLVVWSKLDQSRLSWRRAKTMREHTENIIGRIYRKFIYANKVEINWIIISPDEPREDYSIRPNDPLYLMGKSSTPEPFGNEAMFEPFGDESGYTISINYNGIKHDVKVRCAIAKANTVELAGAQDRGKTPYGKHAAHNRGVSLVRADREISLGDAWCDYDPRERWWGLEVDFPPTLDEIFGVTNNKQSAIHFESMAHFNIKDENESPIQFKERLKEEKDPRVFLVELVDHVQNQIHLMRKVIRKQGKSRKRPEDSRYIEDIATTAINQRIDEGRKAPHDDHKLSENDKDSIQQALEQEGETSEDAAEKSRLIVDRKWRTEFIPQEQDTPAIFSVKELPQGVMLITFNAKHPAHKSIMEALETEEHLSYEEIYKQIEKIKDAVKLLFISWGRYEIESGPEGSEERDRLEDTRHDWGRIAKEFLRQQDE